MCPLLERRILVHTQLCSPFCALTVVGFVLLTLIASVRVRSLAVSKAFLVHT